MIGEAVPAFDSAVPHGGYAWWYLDAVSDDERFAVVVIALLGNPFSPFYASARSRGTADPLDFVAVNVALYGPTSSSWALTERRAPTREAALLAIGPSSMRWDGSAWVVEIDEVCAPLPRRLKGRIVVHPELLGQGGRALDARGAHLWWTVAPRARVEARFSHPDVCFAGPGYLDANAGVEPLEAAFSSWNWSRIATERGAAVSYDVERLDGSGCTYDLAFDAAGRCTEVGGWAARDLPSTRWRVPRAARTGPGGSLELERTLEDTPFYTRSQVRLAHEGKVSRGVHESLSLERFRQRWVRLLLPMRMWRAHG